ncbi:mannose-1-phosphate guanylyltransferase [Candidatus Termititenax dinenymphae]|uniref:Mannose-1-phosphate guanylyltransferase n=1 Tax=Candidatus Termititenax dinenymphae TaxID=2218523 RepID=A0A388TJT8_9BACT|nr:mannose-1-phosphate guanylyltransferase [Candidatus Termititenax dinenymphae]
MRAIILDVGQKKELRELPGQDILAYQVTALQQTGFDTIIVLSDLFAEDYKQSGAAYYACPSAPKYDFLKSILNDEPFLLINGPALTDFPPAKLMDFFRKEHADVLCLTARDLTGETFSASTDPEEYSAQFYVLNPVLFTYYFYEYFEIRLFLTEMYKHRKKIIYQHSGGWNEYVNTHTAYVRAARYLLQKSLIPGSKVNNAYYGKNCEIDFAANLSGTQFFGANCKAEAESLLSDSLLLGNNTIGAGSRIVNSLLQRNVKIGRNSALDNCLIGEGSVIEDNVRLPSGFVLAPQSIIRSGSEGEWHGQ